MNIWTNLIGGDAPVAIKNRAPTATAILLLKVKTVRETIWMATETIQVLRRLMLSEMTVKQMQPIKAPMKANPL